MAGITSSSDAPSAYVYNVAIGGNQIGSSFVSLGTGSLNASVSRCFFLDINSYNTFFDHESSSRIIKVYDMLSEKRSQLYDILSFCSYDKDEDALNFFEGMRESNDDVQCFDQIMKIFLGAYKKKDDTMVVKTLRFMQNFDYDEIGQIGVSATRIALLDSKSLDVQSAALSLVLCWKADIFRSLIAEYKAPNDPFINIKMRKIAAWCISEK